MVTPHGGARQHVVADAARGHLGPEEVEAADELREDEHLVALGEEGLEQLEERGELAGAEVGLPVAERRVAADLAKPREGGEDRDAVALDAGRLLAETVQEVAAPPELRQVEPPLPGPQLAIAPLLDTVGQAVGATNPRLS